MNFNIRPATNDDKNKIARLITEVLTEFNLEYDESTSDDDLADIERSYTRNGGVFIVLEDEKKEIIGTSALFRENDNECQLRKMYLARQYRSLGLGKKLIEEILVKAAEMKFRNITLETNAGMTAAIRLYEKYGFKKIMNSPVLSPRCNVVMARTIG